MSDPTTRCLQSVSPPPQLLMWHMLSVSQADVGVPQRAFAQPGAAAAAAAGSYHPSRLLVTLHSPPRMRDAHSDHLPEGLDLDHVIDNSHAGDGHARADPQPEDLIFVAGITNGVDAADMLSTVQDHPGTRLLLGSSKLRIATMVPPILSFQSKSLSDPLLGPECEPHFAVKT